MFSKINQLFLRKEEPAPGIEKINAFIHYLEQKKAIETVITMGKRASLPEAAYGNALALFGKATEKWKLAGYDKAFKASRYYILPHTGDQHARLTDHLRGLGLGFLEGRTDGSDYIIGGRDVDYHVREGAPVKVVALVHVFNEADILEETIRHLLAQGVHVHLIDNWSTDGSWETGEKFSSEDVSRERFPAEGPSDHYEWYKQLEYSGELSRRLPYDWFLHYDADEFRYAPWKGVLLRDAIGFIDEAGYNAIDFTILDFRYTPDHDQVSAGFEEQNRYFEFGKRPGHFLQVKGWKKQSGSVNLHDSGGHDIQFVGRKVFPVKFLTKHYSLRSKEQAIKKLVEQRLPRVQKELSERSWHSHIELLIAQQSKGWEKKDLIQWEPLSFDRDYLIERISGVGSI